MSLKKFKLTPKSAARYDDTYIKCPFCHKGIVYFKGLYKYIRCDCGAKFKDRVYAENNVAYKSIKSEKQML